MKKNIGKRILSLALALVLVAGMMPRMVTEAHAAGPITLEGNTYPTNPVEGFRFSVYFYCKSCRENVYHDSNIEGHSFTINSFSYSIANGKIKVSVTGNCTGCNLTNQTGTVTRESTFDCNEVFDFTTSKGAEWGDNGEIILYVWRLESAHIGDATCKTPDTCALCGTSYTDASNHEKRDEFTYSVSTSDPAKHDVKYACCGATKETVAHTAEPTYTVNATDHTKHDKTYSCCEGIAETTGHSYTYTANDFVLTETCANGCDHQAIASIVAGEAIYTGSEITNAATISYDFGTWAGDAPVLSFENNVYVGTATAKMTAGDATASTTFKINPANLSYATVALDPASGTYTGSYHNRPTYTLTYNGKQLVEGTDYIVDGQWTGDFLNAGDYILCLTGKGNFTGTKTLTYTIGKATPAFTAPAAKELTYNGQAKALVEAGSVNPGKLLYRLDDGEYSETVPTATNAGNYTVYYMVEGLDTKNYNEIPSGSVSVTIGKATAPTIDFPTVLGAITYGQKLEEVKLSSYANDYGTFHWNAPTGVPKAGTAGYALDFYPNALALQNYDWKNAGDAQWIADRNALCICPNVTVNKAAAAITTDPTPNDLTYNGEDQPLVTAGSVTGGTMVYSLEKEGTYTADLPQAMDVDTYTVWYQVEADSNHTISAAPASVTVEIKKADASVDAPAAISGLVYNGKEQYLITSAVSMDGTVYYSLDGINYTESLPMAVNAQEYTVYYKVVGDRNHNNMEPKTVTARIAPLNIGTVSIKGGVLGDSFTYNGQEHTPAVQIDVFIPSGASNVPPAEVRLTEDTDYTVTYSDNVNAGQAVVTFTGKGNYTGTITKNFTIDPKPITVTVADIADQTWTGSALTPAVVSPTGLVKETDEYCTVTYTDNTNVGLATVKVEEKGNYTFTAIEKTFLIVPDESLIDGLTTANVTSADKTDVDKAAAMMNNADLNDAPAEDKADWEALKTLANALQERIDAADAADQTQNIQDAENIGAGNVKLDQKQDLEDALKDLEAAKENYSGNYTQEEKAALEADIKRIEDSLAAIERVEDFNTAIDDSLLKEDIKTDMDAATEAAIKDAQAAYGELTDYEKTLIDPADKTKLDTLVAAITAYKVTKGDGGRYTVGSGKTLSFTANGPVRKFDYVQVNGKTIASSNYTVTEGSTIITLKSSYLDKLGYGKHKIQIFYTDGSTDVANFRIYVSGGNPFTGDNTHMMLFTGIMMTSLLCMVMMVMFVPKKKGKYHR